MTGPVYQSTALEAGSNGRAVTHRLSVIQSLPLKGIICVGAAVIFLLLLTGSSDKGSTSSNRAHSFRSLPNTLGSNAHSNSVQACIVQQSVVTYDGGAARTCLPEMCAQREKLSILHRLPQNRRWSAANEAKYMELYKAEKLGGWVEAPQLDYVKSFTLKQHELGIYGAVGEIGVHHGKFLIPLVGNALVDEPAVAIDLFEDQENNVDRSGSGDKAALLKNLDECGIPEETVKLLSGNSMHLSAQNFSSMNWPAFRMLSIDGGHTLEITLHDLMLASCIITDGGLVVVDDFMNPSWIGVTEAMVYFLHSQNRLVPFLHGYNKIWLTTSSHVQQYREFVSSQPKVFECRDSHESRRAVADHIMCYSGPRP